jgi:hypothetical protein
VTAGYEAFDDIKLIEKAIGAARTSYQNTRGRQKLKSTKAPANRVL